MDSPFLFCRKYDFLKFLHYQLQKAKKSKIVNLKSKLYLRKTDKKKMECAI